MSTFVVTGVNKRLSKCYRPSYTNDLDPIYEDKVQTTNTTNNNIQCDNVSTVLRSYVVASTHSGRNNNTDNVVMYKREFSDSYVVKPERVQKQVTSRPTTRSTTSSCRSMIHQMMTNRLLSSSRLEHHVSYYSNNTNSTSKPVHDSNTHSDCHHGVEITRKTSLYQVCDSIDEKENRICQSQKETIETVKTDNKSYKLKPGTTIQRRFMCPIEVKYKRRCFVVCFVMVLFVIGVFVIVSVDGWTYKATGRGVVSDTPIVFAMPPLINFTDVRNSSDYD
ncbi:hypothetical protein ACF0H5_016018 [Mactra antiquata]